MAIQTRPETHQFKAIHVVIAGIIGTVIVAAAVVPVRRSDTDSSEATWNLAPWFVGPLTAEQQFTEAMALHESLTEAQFGPGQVPEAIAAGANARFAAEAIAEHDALIEPFVS